MLASMDSWCGLFRPYQHGIASKQAQIPKKNIRCSKNTFVQSKFDVDLYSHIAQALRFYDIVCLYG